MTKRGRLAAKKERMKEKEGEKKGMICEKGGYK